MWNSVENAFDWEAPFPPFYRISQAFPRPQVKDIAAEVSHAIQGIPGIASLCYGKRVAITAGSRGITAIAAILTATVDCLRSMGAEPFIVPAMGSHGGATAAGQLSMLAELGITEKTVGAPILSSMEVVEIGKLSNGMPVFIDKIASSAGGIIIVNRVKPHTDFSSDLESGLAKMAVLGLGKQHGAATVHSYGLQGLQEIMPQAARLIVHNTPLLFGLASVENAYHEVASITALAPEGIAGEAEKKLLQQAYNLLPCFPFKEIDVLIVEQIGKNISGPGMDPNIIGRAKVHGTSKSAPCSIRTIAVLDITPETHGNASGIGLADVTTRRLVDKIDFEALYINCITAGICGIQRAFIPIVAPNDRKAILTALRTCGQPHSQQARVVRIKNTLSMSTMDISESLLKEVAGNTTVHVQSSGFSIGFDVEGNLVPFDLLETC